MKEEQIHTLILVNEEGVQKCFRYKNINRNEDRVILELKDGEEVHRMVVTQTENGISNLMGDDGRLHRVLGISYRPNHVDEEIYKFNIADSYHKALDLSKFI
ncbi:hypothetical protein [Paenibacillus timonensis]|uniref:hypothetical protein n=1 Tax=Paenibacillus timonensis TaxID=225915 RepID=UPI0022DFDC90|nr:hypothetical protein [Paenibacillus timonensis]